MNNHQLIQTKNVLAFAFVIQVIAIIGLIYEKTIKDHDEENTRSKKKKGRYLRKTSLPKPNQSMWHRIKHVGDDQEFLHFIAFSRESFNELCLIVGPTILSTSDFEIQLVHLNHGI